MSEAHKHRARIFLHRGDLVQAKAAWEAAVEEDRSTNDLRELSNSLGNLGNACALTEDFDAAERCYREVLDIQRTEQNRTPSPIRWSISATCISGRAIRQRPAPIIWRRWTCFTH